MSWASRRQSLILGGTIFVLASFLSVVLVVTLRETPSCADGKQNQDEEGIDCGGGCALLCRETLAPPSVRFVRTLSDTAGRTDIIAYIDNPNPRAQTENASILVELIGTDGSVIDGRTGTVDLPPASTVPVFMSGFSIGTSTLARAFVSFNDTELTWTNAPALPEVPRVTDTSLTRTPTPRLSARIVNELPYSVYDVHLVAVIFDTEGQAIAASETILQRIGPRGTETAVFTWNTPFTSEVGRIEVTPIASLARP